MTGHFIVLVDSWGVSCICHDNESLCVNFVGHVFEYVWK